MVVRRSVPHVLIVLVIATCAGLHLRHYIVDPRGPGKVYDIDEHGIGDRVVISGRVKFKGRLATVVERLFSGKLKVQLEEDTLPKSKRTTRATTVEAPPEFLNVKYENLEETPCGKHLRRKVAILSSYLARVGCVLRAPLEIVSAAMGGKHEAVAPRPSWYPAKFKELTASCEAQFATEAQEKIDMMHMNQTELHRSVAADVEMNERIMHCSAASCAWSAVNSYALKNFRCQSKECDNRVFDPMESSARQIILHGWSAHVCDDLVFRRDIAAVADPSMFRADAAEWAVEVASQSECEPIETYGSDGSISLDDDKGVSSDEN